MQTQVNHLKYMDDKYQKIIDDIFQSTPCINEDCIASAYYLACALKELMTHKDSKYIGKGYIWEKVSKAMRVLDLPIQEKV